MEGKEITSGENSVSIDSTMVPVKNSDVTVREEMEEDGRYILFNAENELILAINSTGKFILENCDGIKTVGQIAKQIEIEFEIKGDIALLEIVTNFLSTLLRAGLIKIPGG